MEQLQDREARGSPYQWKLSCCLKSHDTSSGASNEPTPKPACSTFMYGATSVPHIQVRAAWVVWPGTTEKVPQQAAASSMDAKPLACVQAAKAIPLQ